MSSAHYGICTTIKSLLSQEPAIVPADDISIGSRWAHGGQVGATIHMPRSVGNQPFAGSTRADWQTAVAIDLHCRTTRDGDAYQDLEALLTAAYARLVQAPALPDGSVLAEDIEIQWDVDEAAETLATATLGIRLKHRTADGSLAADL